MIHNMVLIIHLSAYEENNQHHIQVIDIKLAIGKYHK